MPRGRAYSQAEEYIFKLTARALSARSAPTRREASVNDMLMSCPVSALVAGVKIGSGSSADSASPDGNFMPQMVCWLRYSFQPDPARYPRTTHSIASGF